MISPGITGWGVDGHQLRPVREGRLHLHLLQQLGDAVHDVVPGQDCPARLHELGDEDAVPRALEHVVGDDRRGLGQVQPQPAGAPPAGELRGVAQEQAFLLVR